MPPSHFLISNHLAGKRRRTSSIPPVAFVSAARRASMPLFLGSDSEQSVGTHARIGPDFSSSMRRSISRARPSDLFSATTTGAAPA
jgi:hypothetical protein